MLHPSKDIASTRSHSHRESEVFANFVAHRYERTRGAISVSPLPKIVSLLVVVAAFLVVPSDPAAAKGFDELYTAESVCQEVATFQVALRDAEEHTVTIPEGPGPVVAAFISWIGPDDQTPDEDVDPLKADSTINVDGNDIVGVISPGESGHQELLGGLFWHSWNADIGPNGLGLVSGQAAQDVTVSGWKIDPDDYQNFRSGAEITVVYDVSPCTQPVDIVVLSGVDWIYEEWDQPRSTAIILPINPAAPDAVETVRLSFWGVDDRTLACRASGLWLLAGSGPEPSADIELFTREGDEPSRGANNGVEAVSDPFYGKNSSCITELNPAPDSTYPADHAYPGGASTAPYNAAAVRRSGPTEHAELTSTEIDLNLPDDASWIALQLESGGGPFGESVAWSSQFTTFADSSTNAPVEPDVPPAAVVIEAPVASLETPSPAPAVALNPAPVDVPGQAPESAESSVTESAARPQANATGNALALTGSSSATILGGGVSITAFGGLLLLISRRRKCTV